jgi:hypothetical protein
VGEGVRVSDAERQAVIDVLREQTTAGRLTLAEFEERLDEVYRSKTDVELRDALRELPVEPPSPAATSRTATTTGATTPDTITEADLRRRYRIRLRNDVSGFIVPNFVCNLIWAIGDHGYWWPGWVLAAPGAGLLGTLIGGFDPEKERAKLVDERRQQGMSEIERRFEEKLRARFSDLD